MYFNLKQNCEYIFTHGYCDLYAFYKCSKNEYINSIVSLTIPDYASDSSTTVHFFASNGEKLFDIYGNIPYSIDDAINHIKKNFPDLLDDYDEDDLKEAYFENIQYNPNEYEDQMNMPLADIGMISAFGLTTIKLMEEYEKITDMK